MARVSSLFQELKERRIVQIVASTAVSGWVALEVVSALVERGVLPDVVYRVGLVLFLGGVVVSAVVGWYHGEKGHQRATRPEMALLSIVVLATGFFAVQTVRQQRAEELAATVGTEGRLSLNRVAVLYFRDQSREQDLAYLTEGLTESLVERLEGVGGLDVVSLSGSAGFRDTDLPRDSIATLLAAGTIVEGWVEPRGDQLRVGLALFDGDSGGEINGLTFDRPADQVLALQDDLADEAADLLRSWLGQELSVRRVRASTNDVQAWTAYQRGERARRDAEERLSAGDVQGFIQDFGRADSLFLAATAEDPTWAQPTIQRVALASRWGQLSAPEDPSEGRAYLDLALARADSALAKDSRSAQALYYRGTVHFQIWILGLASSPSEADAAFQQARRDLEQATTLDPGLAAAFSTLSILYSQIPDPVEAKLAARRAFEADEFLRSADSVLRRLYQTSYDLEQFREAIQYCQEGARRFPDQPEFVQCRLWLRGAPRALSPDPDVAWSLVAEHLARVPEELRPFEEVRDRLLVAMVLARAEMPDSARAVAARAQAGPDIDPARELLGVEALVHLALGDRETALDRLRVYLTASPEHREGWQWSSHWWWRELQSDPEFQRLMGR